MGGGQNTYNPLKTKGRNKKIITIIILLILIVVTFSFALFNPSINLLGRRNIKISKCELDINFKESDELMLVSKYPISTRQALEGNYKPKTVTITNNSTCDTAYYKLTIKDLINSSINKDVIQYHVVDKQNTMTYKLGDVDGNNKIDYNDSYSVFNYTGDSISNISFIRYNPTKFDLFGFARYAGDVDGDGKITENDADLIDSGNYPIGTPLEEKTTTKEIINVNPDTFLIENSLEKGQTHEYEIIMWININAENDDLYINKDTTKPIEYKYALNIEATDKEKEKKAMFANEFAQNNIGRDGLEKVTHEIDDTLQVDNRFAMEYRYRGGNPSNYVKFNNELWRIIGIIPTEDTNGNVENRFKIVKNTSAGKHVWNDYCSQVVHADEGKGQCDNGDYMNNWTTATINTYLNNDYYNTLTTDAKNMIGTTKYYLGSGYARATFDVIWQHERKKENDSAGSYYYETNPIMQNDANKKIALIYNSDYIYALPASCKSTIYDTSNYVKCSDSKNWLVDMQLAEFSINQTVGYDGDGYHGCFLEPGYFNCDWSVIEVEQDFRPVLTLSSNVKISGGTGTSSNPYILSLK